VTSQALSSGNNSITVPTGATALTIAPPSGNTVAITLKGVNGDTGIALHRTHPTSIGIYSTVTAIVLNAGSAVTVKLIWS
jgi:hypothetical protein